MFYYDDFKTWEVSFGEVIDNVVGKKVVESLALQTFDYIENAGDFVASHTDVKTVSTAIHEWIRAREFCVFHGTRLLPEEILSVQRNGLRPLVATDREPRLRKILERHPKWYSVQDKLGQVLADVGARKQQGAREGQIHFSLSRSGLLNSFNHYLTHGSEFDQHVVHRLFGDQSGLELLNSETVPFVIHVKVIGDELIQGTHPYFAYSDVVGMGEIPGLGRTFLDTWAFKTTEPSFDIAKLRTDCCMMQRLTILPERILNIENLDALVANLSIEQ